MKDRSPKYENKTVPVYIRVVDWEEELAFCECEVEARIATVDDSFDWEGGIREESHQEVTNCDNMVDEILENFAIKYKTTAFLKALKRLIDLAVIEYSSSNNDKISHEIDLIDFIKTEEI